MWSFPFAFLGWNSDPFHSKLTFFLHFPNKYSVFSSIKFKSRDQMQGFLQKLFKMFRNASSCLCTVLLHHAQVVGACAGNFSTALGIATLLFDLRQCGWGRGEGEQREDSVYCRSIRCRASLLICIVTNSFDLRVTWSIAVPLGYTVNGYKKSRAL